MRKLIFTLLFSIMLAGYFIFPIAYATNSVYVWSPSSVPTTATVSSDFQLESGGAILIEQSTGQILYEHNSHEQLRPASVTKVMSILLIMEAIDKRSNFFR